MTVLIISFLLIFTWIAIIPEQVVREKTPPSIPKVIVPLPSHAYIKNVPSISQLPELQRGCEVTALAMLLNYKGVKVSKLTLAKAIHKVPFSYTKYGVYYRGNPNAGFVGDIYSFRRPGYGVNVSPLLKLANRYAEGKVISLTKTSTNNLKENLSNRHPVLVIASANFQKISAKNWRTWRTETSKIRVSYTEHCFLLIGYDKKYFYVRDPLKQHSKVGINRFLVSWKQFGSQAMTIH
jgi:uncharacterized protein YvpB